MSIQLLLSVEMVILEGVVLEELLQLILLLFDGIVSCIRIIELGAGVIVIIKELSFGNNGVVIGFDVIPGHWEKDWVPEAERAISNESWKVVITQRLF